MEKRVSFQINEKNDTGQNKVDTQSLFNKLKLKTVDTIMEDDMQLRENNSNTQIDYTSFFKTIIANQEQIIKLLQGKHTVP